MEIYFKVLNGPQLSGMLMYLNESLLSKQNIILKNNIAKTYFIKSHLEKVKMIF